MLATLEVLKAKHGDCLLLHSGTNKNPQVMLIDGGPSGVFNETLQPRLMAIKNNLKQNPLNLSMVMVSHIDDDHINGIKAMLDSMLQAKNGHQPIPFGIENFWCNSFDDIVGNIQISAVGGGASAASVASVATSMIKKIPKEEAPLSAVIASVDQGRKVRNNAKQLGLAVNGPFKASHGDVVLVRGDSGQKPIKFGNVEVTVIHPNSERLEKLQKEWDKKLKEAAKKGDKDVQIAAAKLLTASDTSPYNLSSIACLVKIGNRKILLTGDARMDDIEEGLKKHNLLENGKLHVDIFKIPHHGSIRNATESLLQKVQADHYVISADGSYDNPDKPLLELLATNIKKGILYMTYEKGKKGLTKKLVDFGKKAAKVNKDLKIIYGKDKDLSIVINLEDELKY